MKTPMPNVPELLAAYQRPSLIGPDRWAAIYPLLGFRGRILTGTVGGGWYIDAFW